MYIFILLYINLILFDIRLNRRGFNELFSNYSLRYEYPKQLRQVNFTDSRLKKEIETFFEIMDVAIAWYPRKADCLHKTLLGYRYLRKKFSIPVYMVVGVRKFPFEAHAWLKIENDDFFDSEIDTSYLQIILNSNNIVRLGK